MENLIKKWETEFPSKEPNKIKWIKWQFLLSFTLEDNDYFY